MKSQNGPASLRSGSFSKIMFLAIAGLLIPPSLIVYGVMELMSGTRA
ncbi:MAG: hypothetical protein HOA58_05775 [Rhodospirillaceae bacterium]|jgi:hypothetical protein|nr:hypothetical protein [Rhodospirillaceae bacterium]MBT3926944.1 hypothetical protein [Rhodospirillaceae bacterium]MBT5779148.1 hypothetical protein [Rhodospirillaceae bacterium]MBT6829012.1 hypothetical protein [Rhodospirillaceae bacterium]